MRTPARPWATSLAAVSCLVLSAQPLTPARADGDRDDKNQICASSESLTPEGISMVVPLSEGHATWDRIQQGMADPYVRGVTIMVNWSDLERDEGKIDWSQVDQIFDAAEKSRQWVHLSVFPGYRSPAWALASGVQTDQFTVPYGPDHGQTKTFPIPWDDVYLGRWLKFVGKLADRYGSSKAFRMTGAAGPTTITDEWTMPQNPAEVRRWLADGYTPQKYLAAWDRTLKTYAKLFPHQCVSLAAPHVPILENGKRDPAEQLTKKQQIVENGRDIFGSRLAIQSNDLHAGQAAVEAPDDTDFIDSYSGKVITGFMMRGGSTGAKPSAVMGAAGDPPLALQRSIDKGMAPNAAGQHVNYLEIYLGDILPDDMQPVLKKTAARFRNSNP